MLIYAAADIHGHPRRIRRLSSQVAAHRPDILLLAGDLSRRRQPEVTLDRLNRLGLPVLLIRGNSDPRHLARLLPSFPRLRSIHLAAVRFGDVEIIGISGTLPLPFQSRLGFKETETETRVSTMLRARSVLVAHPPPYGVRDRVLGRFHTGSRAVRRLVDC
ncbi:metallophosphoesterase family protein, partial [Desulfosarcina sp.]|uniref:metallophosphoesterase family protein n=1 Tax=Desulfosarcina sp. TaxID=2027861 RepID=UPI0029BA0081